MVNKIRAYIEHEFDGVPETKKVIELKEELISNLIEKYNEQLRLGKSEEQAYAIVIAGLGDLSELVESVRPQQYNGPTNQERKRSAALTATAVMLYILSPVMVILFESAHVETLGIILFFTCIAVATGMLIYNHMTRPVYVKQEDSVVEDFKEWRFKTNRHKDAFKSFHSAYWSLVVALYLLLSFLFMSWAFSWIIFIIAAAIENIIKGVMQIREDD